MCSVILYFIVCHVLYCDVSGRLVFLLLINRLTDWLVPIGLVSLYTFLSKTDTRVSSVTECFGIITGKTVCMQRISVMMTFSSRKWDVFSKKNKASTVGGVEWWVVWGFGNSELLFQYTDEHEFSLRRDVGQSSTPYIRLAVILKSVVQRYVGKWE